LTTGLLYPPGSLIYHGLLSPTGSLVYLGLLKRLGSLIICGFLSIIGSLLVSGLLMWHGSFFITFPRPEQKALPIHDLIDSLSARGNYIRQEYLLHLHHLGLEECHLG